CRAGAGKMGNIVSEFGELVEDDIGRIPLELGASVEDFLDVALRAGGPDNTLSLRYPGAQPLEAFLAHALRQHSHAVTIEDARDCNTAPAVIPGRWPDRLVARRVEPAGHQIRDQAAIGC